MDWVNPISGELFRAMMVLGFKMVTVVSSFEWAPSICSIASSKSPSASLCEVETGADLILRCAATTMIKSCPKRT